MKYAYLSTHFKLLDEYQLSSRGQPWDYPKVRQAWKNRYPFIRRVVKQLKRDPIGERRGRTNRLTWVIDLEALREETPVC